MDTAWFLQRLTDMDRPMPRYQPGDIVSRRKGLVMHKGIVTRDGRILHNTPFKGEHVCSEAVQQLTNRQLLMHHTTQKMARPTGFEPVTPAFGGRAFVRK